MIVREIAQIRHTNLTKLVVMKKWFDRPLRLKAFAVWVARRALSGKCPTEGKAERLLFRDARRLLRNVTPDAPKLNRTAAQKLWDRLWEFQNQVEGRGWRAVRVIRNWNLLVVEEALALCIGRPDSPSDGYELAAHFCENYNSRYGNGLSGPSRARILAMARFVARHEAGEEEKRR